LFTCPISKYDFMVQCDLENKDSNVFIFKLHNITFNAFSKNIFLAKSFIELQNQTLKSECVK
jgi:hypothetical protein